ncbi:hypothetical protein FRB95_013201 [Tulasnella sp. JGI-2019a]|nr:hypothetical protein FRB95_013201 [Tulasnella sp. JGI-2019a]
MMASIVLLAPELILNISRYLSVTDAVLFMSCRRYLRSITESRHFWLNLVQCIWSRYDIPPSTFDLLTASTLEPQRTVTRPYRFQHSITKKNLARRSLIKLQRPYTRTAWPKEDCREAILIPGGHWLAALSHGYGWNRSMSSVAVYDIRMPAEKNFAMIAHHVLQTEEDIYSSIAVTPDPTGLGPMIFVQILHDVDPTNKLIIVGSDHY